MTQYNPNDFYPSSGKEINSIGNVVTPADGINQDGSENVVLVKRNAQQVILANAVQTRDTNTHLFPGNTSTYATTTLQDVSMYSDKGIMVYNGQDQAISVNIMSDVFQTPGNTNTRNVIVSSDSLAAATGKWYSMSQYSQLKDPLAYLCVQISSTTAPTTGSVSIYFQGAPR